MWQNVKYYVLAYAIMVGGAVLSSVFQLLGEQFPAGHPVGTIAANLSGVTIGGMIMVIGFLKDARVEGERKRTAEAEARVAAAESRAERDRERAERERERADRERERAAATEARAAVAEERAARMVERYEIAATALIKRLDEMNGNGNTPPAGKDPA